MHPTRQDQDAMRRSLRLLEEALERYAPLIAGLPADDAPAAAFRRSVEVLRAEADRLRLLLED